MGNQIPENPSLYNIFRITIEPLKDLTKTITSDSVTFTNLSTLMN
jgi:hypothetical protein